MENMDTCGSDRNFVIQLLSASVGSTVRRPLHRDERQGIQRMRQRNHQTRQSHHQTPTGIRPVSRRSPRHASVPATPSPSVLTEHAHTEHVLSRQEVGCD